MPMKNCFYPEDMRAQLGSEIGHPGSFSQCLWLLWGAGLWKRDLGCKQYRGDLNKVGLGLQALKTAPW